MAAAAADARPAETAPADDATQRRMREMRGELKKLQDCLGLDEDGAWRKLSAGMDARSDRNFMADMVVLKETNQQLRRRVEDLKAQVHDQTQKYLKLRDLLNVRSNEAKEAKRAVADVAYEREQRLRAEAQVALLQQQLRDALQQLDDERVTSCRMAENLVYPLPRISTATPATVASTTSCACVALLGAVASIHADSTAGVIQLVPELVAAALAAASVAATNTTPVKPATADCGVSTDVSITQYHFYPAIDELPRGQELLRALRDRDAELYMLRRQNPDEGRYRRVIDKLNKLLEEKKKSLAEHQNKTAEWKAVQEAKLKAVEQYNQTLRGMFISVSQEVMRMRGLEVLKPPSDARRAVATQTRRCQQHAVATQSTPQSKPIAIPGTRMAVNQASPLGHEDVHVHDALPTGESMESAQKGSYEEGGSSSCQEVYLEE